MGLGLVGAGMGFGLVCAVLALLSGAGWLWAGAIYALSGSLAVLGGAGLVLWRSAGAAQASPPPEPRVPPRPHPRR